MCLTQNKTRRSIWGQYGSFLMKVWMPASYIFLDNFPKMRLTFWYPFMKLTLDPSWLSCFLVSLIESGRLFTFGVNDWGQLGIDDVKVSTRPCCVKSKSDLFLNFKNLNLIFCISTILKCYQTSVDFVTFIISIIESTDN